MVGLYLTNGVERDKAEVARDNAIARADLAESELAAERARTDALVAALPKCGWCGSVATKAFERGGARYCDDCGRSMVPDYPRAEPLRAIAHARRLAAGGEEK